MTFLKTTQKKKVRVYSMIADDDTDNVHDDNIKTLEIKIQAKANASTDWISDN